jgi:hypothetical protein
MADRDATPVPVDETLDAVTLVVEHAGALA